MNSQKRFNDNINLAKFFIMKNRSKHPLIEYDDLWQTVLIGLWKASVNFNGEEKAWTSFAYACMRNEISAEKWRTIEKNGVKADAESLSLDLTYSDGTNVYNPSIEYDYSDSIMKECVRKEILKLSKKQRYCIQKRYFEGMKIVDIAKELNCSSTNVKGIINYAKSKIEKRMKLS